MINNFDNLINKSINEPVEEGVKSKLALAGLAGSTLFGALPKMRESQPTPIEQQTSIEQPTQMSHINRIPTPTRDWKGIVVHHTASPDWTTVEDIDNWHKERGWDGIGYHFVIYPDGSVHAGRSLNKQGAHAKDRNTSHIGIALVGNDNFTTAQRHALGKLTLELIGKYNIESVERHHENCPGGGIDVEVLNNTLQNMRNDRN